MVSLEICRLLDGMRNSPKGVGGASPAPFSASFFSFVRYFSLVLIHSTIYKFYGVCVLYINTDRKLY